MAPPTRAEYAAAWEGPGSDHEDEDTGERQIMDYDPVVNQRYLTHQGLSTHRRAQLHLGPEYILNAAATDDPAEALTIYQQPGARLELKTFPQDENSQLSTETFLDFNMIIGKCRPGGQ